MIVFFVSKQKKVAYITGTSLSNNAIVCVIYILYKNMQEFVIYEIIDMHLHYRNTGAGRCIKMNRAELNRKLSVSKMISIGRFLALEHQLSSKGLYFSFR